MDENKKQEPVKRVSNEKLSKNIYPEPKKDEVKIEQTTDVESEEPKKNALHPVNTVILGVGYFLYVIIVAFAILLFVTKGSNDPVLYFFGLMGWFGTWSLSFFTIIIALTQIRAKQGKRLLILTVATNVIVHLAMFIP